MLLGFLPFFDFLCFLWTTAAFGSRREPPEKASAGQPFGRPRSNGPEIDCTAAPFSTDANTTVNSGSTRGSAHSFLPIANWPVIVS